MSAEWVKGQHATCRAPGTSSPSGHCAWQAGASCLGFPHPLPGLATSIQGEGDSQSHHRLPASSHVRGRLSTCLCGKEAGAVSILFHSRHEPRPADMRSHQSNIHPPQWQFLQSRGLGERCERNTLDFYEQTKPPSEASTEETARSKNSYEFAW